MMLFKYDKETQPYFDELSKLLASLSELCKKYDVQQVEAKYENGNASAVTLWQKFIYKQKESL